MKTKVLIVGDGIAGSVLSLLLKRRGIDHILLGRTSQRKYFSLAETLPPSSLSLLDTLGLHDLFSITSIKKTYGYHSMWGNQQVKDHNFFFSNPYKHGLKINKFALLKALKEQINEHHQSFDQLTAVSSEGPLAHVDVFCGKDRRQFEADVLIDATGRNRALLKLLQIETLKQDDLMAFSCHLPKISLPKLKHSVYVESFEHGWGIVSHLSDDTNVVSLFTNKHTARTIPFKTSDDWASLLANTQYLKELIPTLDTTKLMGGDASSSHASQIAGKNWMALGDAAISFDPLSSHGITTALYSAQQASNAICNYFENGSNKYFNEYGQTLTAIFNQYLVNRRQIYNSELRWKDAPFWKSMQAV